MNLVTQIVIALLCVIFLIYVIRLVIKGRLLLKYSLAWMLIAIAIMACAVFPYPIIAVGDLLGFDITSNFVFFVGMSFLLAFCLGLCIVVSQQANSIKKLTQRLAVVEKELLDSGESS